MGYFYSDLISWSTAGLMAGAVALSAVDLKPAERDQARAQPERAIVLTAATTDAAPAAIKRAVLQSIDIPQARLETVTFTATDDLAATQNVSTGPKGRVTGNSVNLREGPGTGFAVVDQASRGQEFAVTGSTDGAWVEVELSLSGNLAWIHGKFFKTPQRAVLAQN